MVRRTRSDSAGSGWSAGALLATLVVVWIGMVAIATVLVRQLESSLLLVAGQGLARTAASLSDSISRVMYEHGLYARTLAQVRSLREGPAEAAADYLRFLKLALPDYVRINVTNAEGQVVASSDPTAVGTEEGQSRWFQALRQHALSERPFAEAFDQAARALIFPAPMVDDEGRWAGAVILRVDLRTLEFLFDAARRSSAGVSDGGGFVEYRLVADNGLVLYEPAARRTGQSTAQAMDRVPAFSDSSGYRFELHPQRGLPVVTGYAGVARYGRAEEGQPRWLVLARMDRSRVVGSFHRRVEQLLVWAALTLIVVLAALAWLLMRVRRALQAETVVVERSPASVPSRASSPPSSRSQPTGGPQERAEPQVDAPSAPESAVLTPAVWEEFKRWVRLAEVNRVALFKNHRGEGGEQWASRRYEWIGRGEVARSEWSQWFSWSLRAKGFGRWEDVLSRREVISGSVETFPEPEAAALDSCGIRNVLVVPLFAGREWWGFVEFDHCLSERQWSDAELRGLTKSAAILEAAIGIADEREFQRVLRQLDAALESTTDGVLVVDADGHVKSFNQRLIAMWQMPDAVAGARTIGEITDWMMRQLKVPELLLRTVSELHASPETESYDILELLDGRLIERVSTPHLDGGRADGRIWTFRELTPATEPLRGSGSPTEERA